MEELPVLDEIKKSTARILSHERAPYNSRMVTSTPYCFYQSGKDQL